MPNTPQPPESIQSYSLFGESQHLPDVLHCETIADRSSLHDWEVAPHRHARLHQVLLVKSGGGEVELDASVLTIKPRSLVNIPAGHVHAFRFQPHTQGWVVTLADELMDDLFVRVGDVRRDLGRACVVQADKTIELSVAHIWQEFSAQSKARALVLRGLSAALLGWVSRKLAQNTLHRDDKPGSLLMQHFVALIDLHYAHHWQVSDYAQALAISPTHLSRVARAATGQSALRMIEARLMREARRNLAYTHLSVSSIAYSLGYADPAYFTRAFKRDTGISPTQFRTHR